MKIIGSNLSPLLQSQVKSMFVHRFTGEHKPTWVNHARPDGSHHPPQLKDDADWLANTTFEITKRGELSAKHRFCESNPTWPNNPELRKSI